MRNATANEDSDLEDECKDNASDTASVRSNRSAVSVRSTRSQSVVQSSNGAIPRSQDAQTQLKTPTSSSLSPSSLRGTGKNFKDAPGSPQANRLSPAALQAKERFDDDAQAAGGGSTGAANEFIYDGIVFDPQDAVDMRNEKFTGGKKRTKPQHAATNLITSHQPGRGAFVINDFVIKTMEEEMLPSPAGRVGGGSGVAIATDPTLAITFGGDRELRNSDSRWLLGHGARVKAIAVAPDERTFVSCSVEDNDILQQFVNGHGELFFFTGHGAAVVSLSFSRDGHYFASTSRDASIAVWDAQQGTVHRRVRWLDADCGGGGSIPIANAFSWNGQYIVAGYQDRVCRVWDLERNAVTTHFSEHEGIVICVACHPTEMICASGGADKLVYLWHVETGAINFKLTGHENAVISVNFTPNGESLISSDDRSCKLWEVVTGRQMLNVNVVDIVPANSLQSIVGGGSGSGSGRLKRDSSLSSSNNSSSRGSSGVGNNSNNATSGIYSSQTHQQSSSEFTLDSQYSNPGTPDGGQSSPTTAASHPSKFSFIGSRLQQALNGRNSLATAKRTFQSTAAISQRIAFTVSCPCPGQFSTGYFAVASTAKVVHIISMSSGKEEMSFVAKAPVFALASGREETLMYGDTYGNLYVADLR